MLRAADGSPLPARGAVVPVDAARLPPHVVNAFLAIEDRRFAAHPGLDARGLLRAALANLRAGHIVQGGSTITQQWVKNAYLADSHGWRRKLIELPAALWAEAWLTKPQILSRYLSTAYFGDGAHGLHAAARRYFGKPPEALTLAEAAMLAGLVKAPSRLAPTRDPAAAAARMRVVLRAMADAGFIAPAAMNAPTPRLNPAPAPAGDWFTDWAARQPPTGTGIGTGITTLDPLLQRRALDAVARAPLDALDPALQVAVVAMRPDGRVVAMVGGRDYRASPFNRAVQARRQTGSTFKLFAYLAALRQGWRPDDPLDDQPVSLAGWHPVNADHYYAGATTLREAFARSANAAAINLTQATGRFAVIDAARMLGLDGDLPDVPSLPLGTADASLLRMTAAYAAFAAGASPVMPRAFADAPAPPATPLDPQREWAPMLDLLWSAANFGTGRAAALSQPSFGKTGTSQGGRDAWFIGFSGGLVVGVWVGRDDNRPVRGLSGAGLPVAIWRDIMQGAPLTPMRLPVPDYGPAAWGTPEPQA